MPARDQDLLNDPPSSINPYIILEIEENASADEIKSAYKKKALKHHPGMNFVPFLA
jgi:DnaJ homolog subfamily C member 9